MLVLMRREGEEIVIGDGAGRVVVRIAQIRGDRVRVGVTAPTTIAVHRREVLEEIEHGGLGGRRATETVGGGA